MRWGSGFWKGAIERAVLTVVAVLATLWIGDLAFDVFQVDRTQAVQLALGVALISLLFSVVSNLAGVGPTGSPSMVHDRPTDPTNKPAGQ